MYLQSIGISPEAIEILSQEWESNLFPDSWDLIQKLRSYQHLNVDNELCYKDIWRLKLMAGALLDIDPQDQVITDCIEKLKGALRSAETWISHNQFKDLYMEMPDFNLLIGAVVDKSTKQTSLVFDVNLEEQELPSVNDDLELLLQIEKSLYYQVLDRICEEVSVVNIHNVVIPFPVRITFYCEVVQSTRAPVPIYIPHDFLVEVV